MVVHRTTVRVTIFGSPTEFLVVLGLPDYLYFDPWFILVTHNKWHWSRVTTFQPHRHFIGDCYVTNFYIVHMTSIGKLSFQSTSGTAIDVVLQRILQTQTSKYDEIRNHIYNYKACVHGYVRACIPGCERLFLIVQHTHLQQDMTWTQRHLQITHRIVFGRISNQFIQCGLVVTFAP